MKCGHQLTWHTWKHTVLGKNQERKSPFNPKLLSNDTKRCHLEGVEIIRLVRKDDQTKMVCEVPSDMLCVLTFSSLDNSNPWRRESH